MNTIDRQAVASRLKNLRGDRSQREVAEAIGVTPMAISQYEQGERIPNDEIKIKIARYYDQSVDKIFFSF